MPKTHICCARPEGPPQTMTQIHPRCRAFTLIELLTVIAIIAILAVAVAVNAGPFMKNAQMIQGLNNMKQIGTGVLAYAAQHDSELPTEGVEHPTVGTGPGAADATAWYNEGVKLAGGKGLYELNSPSDFYQKGNPLFVPGAAYKSKATILLGISMNSLLRKDANGQLPDSSIRLSNFQALSRTVLLLESGVPGEAPLPGQSGGDYDGGSKGGPRNIVARYKRPNTSNLALLRDAPVNILFGDGHAESLPAKDVITSGGGAYFPQIGDNAEGKVCWTLDPEIQP